MTEATTTEILRVHEIAFESAAVQRLIAEMNAERSERMPAFSPSGGSTVKGADFRPPHGVFLVAERNGAALGCGGVRHLAPGIGEIKRLFVSSPARGQGIGRALLGALEDRASSRGYRTLRLDTDGGEPAALALFRSQGYQPIPDYNSNPYARYWFEHALGRGAGLRSGSARAQRNSASGTPPREAATPTRSCRGACS